MMLGSKKTPIAVNHGGVFEKQGQIWGGNSISQAQETGKTTETTSIPSGGLSNNEQ